LKFIKMHGIGNDYVYVDCFRNPVPADPSEAARRVSRSHFGVGADGLILIMPAQQSGMDARMRMFNADGSEGNMCGNGIRCVGKYLYDSGLCKKTRIAVETRSGPRYLDMVVEDGRAVAARVDMGVPGLNPGDLPVNCAASEMLNLQAAGRGFVCVSMGNPHAVCFDSDLGDHDVLNIGPQVESSPIFPEKVNVEFARVLAPDRIQMRVWERGSGETMACGTGACATLVAGVLSGRCARRATLELLGGELLIEWNQQDGHVYMTGPAETVFEGEFFGL
jgi:diaminopimelate epimerase